MNPADLLLNHPHSASSNAYSLSPSQLSRTNSSGLDLANPNSNAEASTSAFPVPPKTEKEQEQEKKDLQLAELLEKMDEWNPIIPDEVTDYYLQRAGFETSDLRVKRLLALATQRFVSSIAADAYQYARTRTAAGPGVKAGTGAGGKDRTRTVLTMEDLSSALKEYGVGAERATYYL